MKKHYEEIDIMKGIAIFLVVLGHSIIVYPIDLHEVDWCRFINDFARMIHMPLFFIVSGFCFHYKGDYLAYIKKKCYRILIPYIVFNVIDCLPRAFASGLVNRPRGLIESIYSIFVLGGAYWFLYSLFLIFLFFPLVAKYLNNGFSYGCAIIICVILKFIPNIPKEFLLWRTVYHLLYFVIGYCIRDILDIERISAFAKRHPVIITCTILVLYGIVASMGRYYSVADSQVIGIPMALIGIIASFALSLELTGHFMGKVFSEFGKYSLQIYLLNGFALTISRTFSITLLKIQNPAVIIGINLVFDLFIMYLFIKVVLSRYKVTRLLTGIV